MTQFRQEFRVFRRLKSNCSEEAKVEYETAIAMVQRRFNTTIYENRFVVGGAIEVFTCALLRSVGIDCTLYADRETAGDILLPNSKKLSVKSRLTGKQTMITLMNKQGGGLRPWNTATLFVLADVGIVFGAPDMVDQDSIRDYPDKVTLLGNAIRTLAENPMNVFSCSVARKEPTEMTGLSYKASSIIARDIMEEARLEILNAAFDPSPFRFG